MSYYEHHAISRSDLLLFRRGPNHYKYFAGQKKSKAMDLGTLLHQSILEPHKPLDYSVKPAGMNLATKEGKAWKATAKPIVISEQDQVDLLAMTASFNAHPFCQEAMKDSQTEVEHYFNLCDVDCRARLDIQKKTMGVIDVKTTRHLNPRQLGYEFRDRGIDLQAGFYTLASGLDDFYVIYILKTPPYEIMVKQVPRSQIINAQEEVTRLIEELKWCSANDIWQSRIPVEPTLLESSFVEIETPEEESATDYL